MELRSNKKRKALSSEQESSKSATVPRVNIEPDNGFIVEMLREGKPDSKKAVRGARISVCYIGKLQENGKIFDDSRKTPFEFLLGAGEFVWAFESGLEGMCAGEKRKITIHPAMGYGAWGDGNLIPPNAWLVFEVELIDVSSKIEPTCRVAPKSIGFSIDVLCEGKPDGKIALPRLSIGIRYTGMLQKNGKVFFSNIKGKPFRFKLGHGKAVKGLDMGVTGMRVGEKRKITVPPYLGYGQYRDGDSDIPPHAWLIFEVELVDVRLPRWFTYSRYNSALLASTPTS